MAALGIVTGGESFSVGVVAAVLLGGGAALVYMMLRAGVCDVAHRAW